MGQLDTITVVQQTSRSLIVGWTYIPVGVDAAAPARVQISRSDVENEGFALLAEVDAARGWYEDTDVDVLDRWATTFYKLRLIVGERVVDYPPHRLSDALDAVARALRNHTLIYIRHAGVPILVYQSIRSGERCRTCWDAVLRKITRSDCPSCFGTGKETGYYSPVLTLGVMGVEGKINTIGDRVEQDATVEMLLAHYPVLRPNDIVYEIDTGRRYRLQQVLPTEKHRMLINQSVVGYALSPSNAEHAIPIPDITKLDPFLVRTTAPARIVSSTDGERFNYQKFSIVDY